MDEIHPALKKVLTILHSNLSKSTDNVWTTTHSLFLSLLLELGVVDNDGMSICDCKVVSFSSSWFSLSSKVFWPSTISYSITCCCCKIATISLLPRSDGIEKLVPNWVHDLNGMSSKLKLSSSQF